jgi:hypothetical protein
MVRATDPQRAERLSRARTLLGKHAALPEAAAPLAGDWSISKRQGYRYLEQAQKLKQPVPVEDAKVSFTVKLSRRQVESLRTYGASTGTRQSCPGTAPAADLQAWSPLGAFRKTRFTRGLSLNAKGNVGRVGASVAAAVRGVGGAFCSDRARYSVTGSSENRAPAGEGDSGGSALNRSREQKSVCVSASCKQWA